MELEAQIRKYRSEKGLSQEELAEKVFVTRQSVSNWETGKTYPDIKSLLLLSEVFETSIDNLVKGDIKTMKKVIDAQDLSDFQKDSTIFAVLFILILVLPIPLAEFLGWVGIGVYIIIFGIALYYAMKVEKHKKRFDISTYKEIVAFTEGKELSEIEKEREKAKSPYQKVFLALGAAALTLAVCALMGLILG